MQTRSDLHANVIVIEPSQADRYWLRMMLTECELPHSLHEFSSALAALDALSKQTIDPVHFVFITVFPPLLDISEAVRRLSDLPPLRQARFAVTILNRGEVPRVPPGCKPLMKPLAAEEVCAFIVDL